jgi:signal transduction histidine kinase
MNNNLDEISNVKKILIAILLLILITFFDFFSGNEISFSIFYLIPIVFVSWYINRITGLLFSVFSAFLWFYNDLINQSFYSHYLIPYWNAMVRLGFFVLFTYLISSIKNEREREKEIIHFIAHDLRSPLASILSGFNLLNDDEEPLTKNQKEVIDLNISSGNRMMIFINSLLDLGRLEKKKLPLNITKVNISETILESVDIVRFLAKEKNIELKISNKVDYTNADKTLLLRVIVNLLSNAIQVSNKNTEVEVSTKVFEENNIMFSVRDQGPGIPDELKEKLFNKYIQGSLMTSGSGIGLTFCKLAVEAHNGFMNFKNNEDTGTTVFFVIPIKKI